MTFKVDAPAAYTVDSRGGIRFIGEGPTPAKENMKMAKSRYSPKYTVQLDVRANGQTDQYGETLNQNYTVANVLASGDTLPELLAALKSHVDLVEDKPVPA